jgi:hypothetical protein
MGEPPRIPEFYQNPKTSLSTYRDGLETFKIVVSMEISFYA